MISHSDNFFLSCVAFDKRVNSDDNAKKTETSIESLSVLVVKVAQHSLVEEGTKESCCAISLRL